MASKLGIYNLALFKVGHRSTIQSELEQTSERELAERSYTNNLEATLQDYDWPFARSFLTLSDLGTPINPQWQFMYVYPATCLAPRKILGDKRSGTERIAFEVAYDPNVTAPRRVILTDRDDAILAFTFSVTDTSVFDAMFVDALATRMASELAIPIAQDGRLMAALQQKYAVLLAMAQLATSEHREADTARNAASDTDLSEARWGG